MNSLESFYERMVTIRIVENRLQELCLKGEAREIDILWLQEHGISLFCSKCNVVLTEENWSISARRKYDHICKTCENNRLRNWYNKNKKIRHIASLNFYIKNIERERKRRNNVMLKLKKDCMNALGGKCYDCGTEEIEVLTVEHINGKGLDEYKRLGNGKVGHGKSILYRLIRDRKVNLENYLCLCMNCNMKRRIAKEHKETKMSKYGQKLKRDVLTLLGCKCSNCGIDDLDKLTLEHKQGFGRAHRRQLNKSGYSSTKLYSLIRRGLEPIEKYSVLCFNCNFKTAQKWREETAKKWRKY